MADSRRSSSSTEDFQSRDGISLEFDDYPLDLVSSFAIDPDDDIDIQALTLAAWKKYPPSPKRIYEKDRLLTDEIMTDMGSRKVNNYDVKKLKCGDDDDDNEQQCNGDIFMRFTTAQCNGHVTQSSAAIDAPYHYQQQTMADADNENHYEKKNKGCCFKLKDCCHRICKPFLTKYNPLPEKPTFGQRCKHVFLCPPHGRASQALTVGMLTSFTWLALWAIIGQDALPGGNTFAIVALVVCGYVMGTLVSIIRLPPILGMLAAGCLLRNVPCIDVERHLDPDWAAALRTVCAVVAVQRAGLAAHPAGLRSQPAAAPRLAALPALAEAVAVALSAHLLLGLPWAWAATLGVCMCGAGFAVLTPALTSLHDRGYGVDQGVNAVIAAAANLNDGISVISHSALIGVVFAKGASAWAIAVRGPLEAAGGALCGGLLGLLVWTVPDPVQRSVFVLRLPLLLAVGVSGVAGARALGVPGAGPAAALTASLTAGHGWRRRLEKTDRLTEDTAVRRIWCVCEPLLFGLLGVLIDTHTLSAIGIGLGLAVVAIATAVRLLVAPLVVYGAGFASKEKLFCSIAWIPKATIQAALGLLLIDTLPTQDLTSEMAQYQEKVITVVVLGILVSAPVGSVVIQLAGHRLLKRSSLSMNCYEEDREKVDLAWDDHLDYNPELAKLKLDLQACAVNVKTKSSREITTEMETVT